MTVNMSVWTRYVYVFNKCGLTDCGKIAKMYQLSCYEPERQPLGHHEEFRLHKCPHSPDWSIQASRWPTQSPASRSARCPSSRSPAAGCACRSAWRHIDVRSCTVRGGSSPGSGTVPATTHCRHIAASAARTTRCAATSNARNYYRQSR